MKIKNVFLVLSGIVSIFSLNAAQVKASNNPDLFEKVSQINKGQKSVAEKRLIDALDYCYFSALQQKGFMQLGNGEKWNTEKVAQYFSGSKEDPTMDEAMEKIPGLERAVYTCIVGYLHPTYGRYANEIG